MPNPFTDLMVARKIEKLKSDLGTLFAKVTDTRTGPQTTPAFSRKEVGDTGQNTVYLEDAYEHTGHIVSIRHFGSNSGQANAQTYGIDISNRPGASRALLIHQYSNLTEAVRIDNTDNKAAIRVVNTENQVLNPGRTGSGDAFLFEDWGVIRYKVQGDGGVYIENKDTSHGLNIKGPATGTRSSIYVDHRAPSHGVQIVVASTAANFYPLLIAGWNYGPSFTTSQNGGQTLLVSKNGTGTGEAVRIINKGTGPSIQINQDATPVARVNNDGEYEHLTAGKGDLYRSPDGTRYRLSIANGGTISVTAAP
jgi:hypothetical protein